jgi:hypothetical protein
MQIAAVLLFAMLLLPIGAISQLPATKPHVSPTLFGITAFPYDTTQNAVDNVRRLITDNSTLAAVHLDNGIPWREMLDSAPLPPSIRSDWANRASAIPKSRPVYVGMAPLDTDRKSLAPDLGDKGREAMPGELRAVALDDHKVIAAYLRYVSFAIDAFHPSYLNIGIEAGEIISRDLSRWPQFVKLYSTVYDAVKRDHPEIKIGISFGLGELRSPSEARAAKLILDKCDYVGLSFYPYASGFDEKFGAPPYGGDKPWREPLAWIRKYTKQPIAICETGYSTQDITISQYNLKLKGDPNTQAAYVRELFQTAQQDHYLFVVWFLAVDYDKMYAKMPAGSDAMLLWKNIGMLDGDLHPKPAWEIWKKSIAEIRPPARSAKP